LHGNAYSSCACLVDEYRAKDGGNLRMSKDAVGVPIRLWQTRQAETTTRLPAEGVPSRQANGLSPIHSSLGWSKAPDQVENALPNRRLADLMVRPHEFERFTLVQQVFIDAVQRFSVGGGPDAVNNRPAFDA
jgi:hypothetical protein